MGLEVSRRGAQGITVPYGPIVDDIRRNNGFSDVRGRPDLAAKIVEGTSSNALRGLLVRIARENVYFSLGCDLGSHCEPEASSAQRQVAGGYIQVAAIKYQRPSIDHYDRLCDLVEAKLAERVKRSHWKIDFAGTWVRFRLPHERRVTRPSMWIWFFAAARSKARAVESRERLMETLSDVLHMPEVSGTLSTRTRRSIVPIPSSAGEI